MSRLADHLPGARDEAFKYTSFAALARRKYRTPGAHTHEDLSLPETTAQRLCFVDGRYHAALSVPGDLDITPGVPHELAADGHALRRMNHALADDGLTLSIPADRIVEQPIELLHVFTAHEETIAANTRVRIRVGPQSRCTVIERHIAFGDAADFLNLVTELELAPGASVTYLMDQRSAPAATLVTGLYTRISEHARLDTHSIHLGGGLVRADIDVRLMGRHAQVALNGFHLAGMRQHIDTHTRVLHEVPDTRSEEHYRAVVDRGGRSVFNGKVVVAVGADRSDAQQYNANLLLSTQAEVDTKPELEIYADEVKCAHGATVGKLDEDALFYLRSRGIGEDAARSVLVWAFADTVLSFIPHSDLRANVEDAVLARLPDAERIREFR